MESPLDPRGNYCESAARIDSKVGDAGASVIKDEAIVAAKKRQCNCWRARSKLDTALFTPDITMVDE